MKIKRYFAADVRTALKQVREEQGPDAVILSNRAVQGGVEIVAAVDFDPGMLEGAAPAAAAATAAPRMAEPPEPAAEPVRPAARPQIVWSQDPAIQEMKREINTLRGVLENQLSGIAWGEMNRRNPVYTETLKRLMTAGFSVKLCRRVAQETALGSDTEAAWRSAMGMLAQMIPVEEDAIVGQGGVVALVGPTGVGKTTTIAKLAARCLLRHGRHSVGLVTTDTYRIGAQAQLAQYGRIMDAPVKVAQDPAELKAALRSLADRKLVLIDTAGMSHRDVRLSEQFALLHNGGMPVRTYLVLPATTQLASLNDAARAFQAVRPAGCILTKLDESLSLGAALSAVIQHRLPVACFTDGQRVPEDLHPARAHLLVQRAAQALRDGVIQEDEPMALTFGRMAAHAQP